MKIFFVILILLSFLTNFTYSNSVKLDNLIEINILIKKYYASFSKENKKFQIYDEFY